MVYRLRASRGCRFWAPRVYGIQALKGLGVYIVEKCWGFIGIIEKKMETTRV